MYACDRTVCFSVTNNRQKYPGRIQCYACSQLGCLWPEQDFVIMPTWNSSETGVHWCVSRLLIGNVFPVCDNPFMVCPQMMTTELRIYRIALKKTITIEVSWSITLYLCENWCQASLMGRANCQCIRCWLHFGRIYVYRKYIEVWQITIFTLQD